MSKTCKIIFVIFFSWGIFLFGCASRNIKPIPDADTQFEIAKRVYNKKHYSDSVIEFQKLIFNYPGYAYIDSAQYLLAMSYFKDKDYASAAAEFRKLVSSFPTSSLSDEAFFMVGLCDYELSPKPELDQKYTFMAIEGLESFLDEYPESELVSEAQRLLLEARSKLAKKAYKNGELYVKMKEYDSALIYLDEVIDNYSDTPWAGWALFQKGEVYRLKKKNNEAKEYYQKVISDFPQSPAVKKAQERLKKLR